MMLVRVMLAVLVVLGLVGPAWSNIARANAPAASCCEGVCCCGDGCECVLRPVEPAPRQPVQMPVGVRVELVVIAAARPCVVLVNEASHEVLIHGDHVALCGPCRGANVQSLLCLWTT